MNKLYDVILIFAFFLASFLAGIKVSEYLTPITDVEDEGILRLAQETFQGYPYFYIEETDWVIQSCYDGTLWQGHDYMRWTDGALLRITGGKK